MEIKDNTPPSACSDCKAGPTDKATLEREAAFATRARELVHELADALKANLARTDRAGEEVKRMIAEGRTATFADQWGQTTRAIEETSRRVLHSTRSHTSASHHLASMTSDLDAVALLQRSAAQAALDEERDRQGRAVVRLSILERVVDKAATLAHDEGFPEIVGALDALDRDVRTHLAANRVES